LNRLCVKPAPLNIPATSSLYLWPVADRFAVRETQ